MKFTISNTTRVVFIPNFTVTHAITSTNVTNSKATSNKFSVSHPRLKHICMWVGGPFPLFHYKTGSFQVIICLAQPLKTA